MIKFVCINNGCVNKDIEYYFQDEVETAECGGCKTILQPQETDVEAPPALELPF